MIRAIAFVMLATPALAQGQGDLVCGPETAVRLSVEAHGFAPAFLGETGDRAARMTIYVHPNGEWLVVLSDSAIACIPSNGTHWRAYAGDL